MAEAALRPATYADLEQVPPNLVAEIVYGVLHTRPRPVRRHIRTASRMGMILGGAYDLGAGGPGGWVFDDEPELHLGHEVVVPDLAAWRIDRSPADDGSAWTDVVPDWICEIMSPSTARLDRGPKKQIYAEFGVGYLWLLDLQTRYLDAYRLLAGNWMRIGALTGEGDIDFPPFDATSFPIELFFPSRPTDAGKKP